MGYLYFKNQSNAASNGIPKYSEGRIPNAGYVGDSDYGIAKVSVPADHAGLLGGTQGTALERTIDTDGYEQVISKVIGPVRLRRSSDGELIQAYVGDNFSTAAADLNSGEALRLTLSTSSTQSDADNSDNRFTNAVYDTEYTVMLEGQIWRFYKQDNSDFAEATVVRIDTENTNVLVFFNIDFSSTIVDGTDNGGLIVNVEDYSTDPTGIWEYRDDNNKTIASNKA